MLLQPLAALALLPLLLAAPALATPRLPAQVRSDLSLSYTPQCSLCHIRGNTGLGTEITPFALSARALGMTGNTRELATALQAMKSAGVDSDGDGVPDIQELILGTDPNIYGPVPFSTQVDPSYGCASLEGSTLALLAALALLLGMRRSRRAAGYSPR